MSSTTLYEIVNCTCGFITIVLNSFVLYNVWKFGGKKKAYFLTQMTLAGCVTGVCFFLRGLLTATSLVSWIGCKLIISVNTASIGVYIFHMTMLYIDLYLSLRKLTVKSVMSLTAVIAISALGNAFWIAVCFLGMNFVNANTTLVSFAQCSVGVTWQMRFNAGVLAVFFLMMVVMITIYSLSMRVAKRGTESLRKDSDRNEGQRARMLKMMRTMLTIYGVCWMSALAFQFLFAFCIVCKTGTLGGVLYPLAQALIMVPYMVNGVIYVSKNEKFVTFWKKQLRMVRPCGKRKSNGVEPLHDSVSVFTI